MEELVRKTLDLSKSVNRMNEQGRRQYLLISDFGKSSVASETGYLENYFRIFTPVKPLNGRKLNSEYSGYFNPFKDTLMDYPTIVQYKLGKVGTINWEDYNRLIALHTSRCPLNCWHCYLDGCLKSSCVDCGVARLCKGKLRDQLNIKEGWFTATEIVDGFIKQRESDKEKNLKSNILRITGGEPFLVPGLILEVLNEIRRQGLHTEIFVWTETNLIPFIVIKNVEPIINENYLIELSKHKNICVHPCFHGLDADNFKDVTGQKIGKFEYLIKALKRLINAQIDIYPTFGSNIAPPSDIEQFYQQMANINESLPLRFCLIEYDLDYKPIKWRRDNIPNFAEKHEKVYDRFFSLEKWDDLLFKNTGHHYGDVPRHLVSL